MQKHDPPDGSVANFFSKPLSLDHQIHKCQLKEKKKKVRGHNEAKKGGKENERECWGGIKF